MKWYINLTLTLELEAENYTDAEYITEDIIAELRVWNNIPKYTKIFETSMDALEFEQWVEDWNPYF